MEVPVLTGSVTVRVLTDLDEIKANRDRLITLREAAASRNPFAGPEWTLAWYAAFCTSPRRRPWLIEVSRDATLLGVVPMWQQVGRFGPGVLRPVGRGRPWIGPFEIPGALALADEGREVGRAAIGHLCQVDAEWTWAHVALGDAASWLEPNWLPSDEFSLLDRGTVATVVLELSPDGPPFRPRRNLRESLRRSRNRLDSQAGADGWRVARADDPIEVASAFGRLYDLHQVRSARTDKSAIHDDVLAEDRVREYVGSVVAEMAAAGLASVYELLVNDTVIAAQLVLRTSRSTHLSISGQRDSAWHFSAITHLQWCAVQDAEAARHELVDFSAGPIQSKLRWSTQVRSYHEFAIVAPRRSAQLAYLAELPRYSAARLVEARHADRRRAR